MTKRLLPFKLTPSAWFLKGKSYDEAEAHHNLDGYDLDRRIIEIHEADPVERAKKLLAVDLQAGTVDAYEYDIQMLKLDGKDNLLEVLKLDYTYGRIPTIAYEEQIMQLTTPPADLPRARLEFERRFGKIDAYTYDRKVVELMPEGKEREIALFDVDLAHEKITKREHEKAVATVREEPWIGVIDDGFDLNQGVNGLYFELDWNKYWIDYLRLNGYGGRDEDAVVKSWFADVCMNTVYEAEEADEDPAFVTTRGPLDRGYRS